MIKLSAGKTLEEQYALGMFGSIKTLVQIAVSAVYLNKRKHGHPLCAPRNWTKTSEKTGLYKLQTLPQFNWTKKITQSKDI